MKQLPTRARTYRGWAEQSRAAMECVRFGAGSLRLGAGVWNEERLSGTGQRISLCSAGGRAFTGCALQAEELERRKAASWPILCEKLDTGAQTVGKKEEVGASGFLRSKLAVFVSGGGSNFRALHEASLRNEIYGQVDVVVSDKPGCKGCEYAREHDIPVLAYPKGKNALDGISSSELVDRLREYSVDYVLLAGYLRLLPPELVQAYPRSILNIHPALLPAFGGKGFYGMKVHEAVIKSGARFSGATIHFIDEKYDTGPILAQRTVPVLPDDTPHDLAARVLKEEHKLYVEAVAALCEDRIFWREDGVPLIRKSWDGAEYY